MTGQQESLRGRTGEALVQQRDLQGDLHCHTTYSDGTDSLREMAGAASAMGYRYLAITDHAQTGHVHSLSEATLQAQRTEIDSINAELGGKLLILQGVELDIAPDGTLPDLGDWMQRLDVVIASIHSHFELNPSEMTERVVTALSHPFVNILGHPTARRTGTRLPVEMDLPMVFKTAAEKGIALEINSTPTRLDLRDDHIRLAREFGCLFSIDTDSHAAAGLGRISLGIEMAQKGSLTSREVVNCLDTQDLLSWLKKR